MRQGKVILSTSQHSDVPVFYTLYVKLRETKKNYISMMLPLNMHDNNPS